MSKIVASGSYLPERIVDNTTLVDMYHLDSSDEWIQQRTGIKQRHFASDDETLANIASKACENLLNKLDKDIRQEIKLIIVATMSAKSTSPSVANKVQMELGADQAWCFDINAACSGFVFALEAAEKISKNYQSGYTLIVGAEKMSQILNFEDRGTAVIFGDGAGALLIEHDGQGLPDYRSNIHSQADPNDSIVVEPNDKGNPVMSMKGRDVFNFVLRQVIPSLKTFTKSIPPYDYLISHQANYRFLEIISKKLKLNLDRIPSNIDKVGNISAASIPVLIDELVTNKILKLDGSQSGLLTGFGAGLSWGEIYLKL